MGSHKYVWVELEEGLYDGYLDCYLVGMLDVAMRNIKEIRDQISKALKCNEEELPGDAPERDDGELPLKPKPSGTHTPRVKRALP